MHFYLDKLPLTCGALLSCGLVLTSAGRGQAEAPPAKPPEPLPATCVQVHPRVRYSLGYDHLVDLKNGCPRRVSCEVWTNVNPERQTAVLGVQESATVVTYIGSPAREFQPQTECKYLP